MTERTTGVRRFEVWLDVGVSGKDPTTRIVEVGPGEDADELCSEALDDLIANELDTGWRELPAEEA